MSTLHSLFLSGVPEALIRKVYNHAAGNAIESGNLARPHSSASLANNGFRWFLEHPGECMPLTMREVFAL